MKSRFHSFFIYSVLWWLLLTLIGIPTLSYFVIKEISDTPLPSVILLCCLLPLFYLALTRFSFQTFAFGQHIKIARWPLYKSITINYHDIVSAQIQQRTETKQGYHYVGSRSIVNRQHTTRTAKRGVIVLKNGLTISMPDNTYSNIEQMIAFIESKRTS